MKEHIFLLISVFIAVVLFAGTAQAQEGTLVIRQAIEDGKGIIAVEGYLNGDLLKIKISAGMERVSPRIQNVIIEGPKLGVINPIVTKEIFANMEQEEEEPYEVLERGGMIGSRKKPKLKSLWGRVTRKLVTFRIPMDKIVPDGKYYLRVKAEGYQGTGTPDSKGKKVRFKYYLENLPKAVVASRQ